ncbi:MAG TPA: SpoVR family protein [Steroidobacteraceae bacterium]|nr:SpoVR family protein [Steroidobacteraceae bacterium]
MSKPSERLFNGADWDFQILQRIHDACEDIAQSELGLNVYPNQIEVITAEQMLDAYSSVGMPLFYKQVIWQAFRVPRSLLPQGADGAGL